MVETTSRTILLILILASLAAGLAAGVGIGGYALVRTTTFTETRTLTETSLSLTVHPITLTETLTETKTFFQTLTETHPASTHTIYETVTEVATMTVTETITTKIEATTATTQTPSGRQLLRVKGGEGSVRSPIFVPQTDTLRIKTNMKGCLFVNWILIDKESGDWIATGSCGLSGPRDISYIYDHHIGAEHYLQIEAKDGRDCEWTITVEDVGD